MKIAQAARAGKPESLLTLAEEFLAYVRTAAAEARPLHEVERTVLGKVLEIGFAGVELLLALQGDGDLGPTLPQDDGPTLHRSAEPLERRLRTVFGEHLFYAYVYAPGAKKKIALRPIDARLALPPGCYSYFFEELTQYVSVEQAFGRAREAVQAVLGQDVPVDSLEHLNRRVGQQAATFLDALPAPVQPEGALLVVSADAKGVPLVDAEAQQLPVFEKLERPGNRRMATLGCVYSVDRYKRTPQQIIAALFRDDADTPPPRRPVPQHKHLLARFTCVLPEEEDVDGAPLVVPGAVAIMAWANEEVRQRHRPGQPTICLMDGQTSLWDAATECLDAVPAGEWLEILDVLHVASYVWRAAKVLCPQPSAQAAFVRDRLLRILQGEARGVLTGLRRMASQRGLVGAACKEMTTVCGYLTNNLDRMHYDVYLREGYPIATGVIEGACRHLVKDRLERSGMRWTLAGAQAMLDVRAAYQSAEWETFLAARIATEQAALHPLRHLLSDYAPQCLAL